MWIKLILHYQADCPSFLDLKTLTLPCVYIHQCRMYIKQNLNIMTSHSNIHNYPIRYSTNLATGQFHLSKAVNGTECYGIKIFEYPSSTSESIG